MSLKSQGELADLRAFLLSFGDLKKRGKLHFI